MDRSRSGFLVHTAFQGSIRWQPRSVSIGPFYRLSLERAVPVPPTQLTLLARLRDAPDDLAWRRFEAAYRDLVVRFAMRQGLQSADAEDVAQAVFVALASALKTFVHDPAKGRFRDYLFRAVRNEIARSKARAARPWSTTGALVPDDLTTIVDSRDDDGGEARRDFEEEWIDHHYRTALVQLRSSHSAESIAILERLVKGEAVDAVAAAFATTPAAVHKIKQRMRDRMREIIEVQIAKEDG